ncbi:hypothetical protein TRIUR3_32432 [Triticum urartu]|uniref:Uncharacterized protein n=1 Tax=Triticum urartu TaxID=4572 RepID=M7ZXB3_TRIUA|nr:hypothetical protein TRIUR3_32432 [Triticum urartu]
MALEEGARVAAAAEARVAWLWRSMAGVRAASWWWSRGEARVAAAAELLCNIVPMNPLPHLASAGFSMPLFERKDMKKRIFRVSQAHKLKVHQVQGKKSFPRHVAAAVKTRAALTTYERYKGLAKILNEAIRFKNLFLHNYITAYIAGNGN